MHIQSAINVRAVVRNALVFAGLASWLPAQAQTLEEIVVTAQKREQNVQGVPASITAFSGAQLDDMGVTDVRLLVGHVPNLQFTSLQGAGATPSLAIRGIGLSTFTDDNENPVAFYFDDVYVGTLGGVIARTFDIERVEVLRGPQGTLYGRNTTGGLVHFVSRDPTASLEGYATAGFGSWDGIKAEGAVGGPITDNLRARLSYSHDERDGFQSSWTTGIDHGAEETDSVRLKVALDSSENLRWMFSGHYADLQGDSWASDHFGELDPVTGANCSVEQVFSRQCIDVFGWSEPDDDPWRIASEKPKIPWQTELYGGSVRTDWSSGPWSLVNILAFSAVRKDLEAFGYSGELPIITVDFDVDSDQWSEEARVGYTQDNWLVLGGIYLYKDEKSGLIANSNPYTNYFTKDTDSYAAFVHGEYKFSSEWSGSIGVRYTSEDFDSTSDVDATSFTPFPPFFVDASASYSNVSWDVGVSWQPNEDLLWFANIKDGFKAGSADAGGFNVVPEAFEPYDSETVTMYEIGLKSTLMNGLARFNATVFYNDYEDFQALTQINDPSLGNNPISVLSNAGNATTEGIELELISEPLEWLEVSAHFSYLETDTEDFLSFTGVDPDTGESLFTDYSGTPLATAPRRQYGAIVRAHTPLFGGEISVQADGSYVSEFNAFPGGNPYAWVGDYWNLNARLGWLSDGGKYEVAVQGFNLSDEYQPTSSSAYAGHRFNYVEMPRRYLATVSFNF